LYDGVVAQVDGHQGLFAGFFGFEGKIAVRVTGCAVVGIAEVNIGSDGGRFILCGHAAFDGGDLGVGQN